MTITKPAMALIGCGHWGRNLLRNLLRNDRLALTTVCDRSAVALASVRAQHPFLTVTADYGEVLRDPAIAAVAVATFPISTHYEIAGQALEAGKHVLVEKPLAGTARQALELAEVAHQRKLVLMVDHTVLYSGAARAMKARVDKAKQRGVLSFDSLRLSPRLVPPDTSVLWDLGAHEFACLDHLCGSEVNEVAATGVRRLSCAREDTVHLEARFESGLAARIVLSALAPVKLRVVLLEGRDEVMTFKSAGQQEHVQVCPRGAQISYDASKCQYDVSGGWTELPLDSAEPLALVVQEFAGAVCDGRVPLSDGWLGYRVVRLLAAAQRSLDERGRAVRISGSGGESTWNSAGSRQMSSSAVT